MFESKEVLEEMFPIGYIYKEEQVSQRFYCADDVILEKIKTYYGTENVEWISPHHVMYKHYVAYTVDGYIYDGKFWYPANHDAQGWHIIPENLLKK
jgi:hypothetical protein